MKSKKTAKIIKITVSIILSIVLFVALLLVIALKMTGLSIAELRSQQLPQKDTITPKYESTYLTEKTSYFEEQGLNQCAGFTASYLLRVNGIEINGESCYQKLSHKFSNGYVLPQAITNTLTEHGFKTTLYKGSLEQLKTHLNKGNPIIALIGHRLSWQHYVTVVGYDEEHIYLYDSLKPVGTNKQYNRLMKNEEFLNWWNNEIPMFEQIYFVIE